MRDNDEELIRSIGYSFRDPSLLYQALTHRSYANEHPQAQDYERLEFLGDAILELVSSAFLYQLYPDKQEGELTKIRASLVCEPALAFCARSLGLDRAVRLGRGEEEGGGRSKASILSDTLEALIGAIYLDAEEDIRPARAFIQEHILREADREAHFVDAKSRLQEVATAAGKAVHYELVAESGPAHEKLFESAVYLDAQEAGRGSGRSKKQSEQQAARVALEQMEAGKTCI